jgi:N-acetylneuraminate synthase
MEFKIGEHWIGEKYPTYFIADIAANHDGNLDRAKQLIKLAKDAGADAAKFQNFSAPKIVSDFGFKSLGGQQSHQSKWKKSVFEVYSDASVSSDWTPILKEECDKVGIDYFSSPYDFEATDMLDAFVPAYKIGSGEIDWIEALERMASKGKPVLLATGAATIGEVQKAVHAIQAINEQLVLMQCNTNYTADPDNFNHIHLNVLKTYAVMFPDVVLGLSDHTHGHATVLGAVALGARVIEKHFTDDNSREGPDHKFAMNPRTWADMVRTPASSKKPWVRPTSVWRATSGHRGDPAPLPAGSTRPESGRDIDARDDRRAAAGTPGRHPAGPDSKSSWHEAAGRCALRQGVRWGMFSD